MTDTYFPGWRPAISIGQQLHQVEGNAIYPTNSQDYAGNQVLTEMQVPVRKTAAGVRKRKPK